jgi:hypothetical protein
MGCAGARFYAATGLVCGCLSDPPNKELGTLRMPLIAPLIQYLSSLSNGKVVLWCYLIWWGTTVIHHFDPSPAIWLNSVGISAVIGFALILSVGGLRSATRDSWQTFRLFAMPFCVSSFSSLIKGKGFILVFPPSATELATSVGLCAAFATFVISHRKARRSTSA